MKYVLNPNLPHDAGSLVIGEKYYPKLAFHLEKWGIKPEIIPHNPFVDERLSSHADISLLHLGGNRVALAPYLEGSEFSKELEREGFELIFSSIVQNSCYPYDAALNVCICGDNLIYNPKTADDKIVQFLTNGGGFREISVKQGYTKCSICIVSDRAIITSDELVHKRAVASGLSSLKIAPGFIDLEGFDYGFIGGASFKLSASVLAFTGHLDRHPDKKEILKFASLHNVKIVYITDEPAFDIGSAIPITEK